MSREQVLLIDVSDDESTRGHEFDLACAFCGLDIARLFVEGRDCRHLTDTLKQKHTQAIVISAKALVVLDVRHLMSALDRPDGRKPPLMVIGVTPDLGASLLSMLSGQTIVGCRSCTKVPFSGVARVSALKEVAQQLVGTDIPVSCKDLDYFLLDETQRAEQVISIGIANRNVLFPVFVKTMFCGHEAFFLTHIGTSAASCEPKYHSTEVNFLEIAPFILFLRYTCGERCWHSPGYYANLTIDDAWLIDPYGFLSYKGLLEQMEKADFHTTIGFIPWNYDRCQRDVVNLFRQHTDRFSVCLHGNNHDSYEFYKYKTEPQDQWQARPLEEQEANIKQGLARMEKFKSLTGISYDPVMIFPHGIAPAKTLGLLKKYNFLAAMKSEETPLDCEEQAELLSRLRAVTLHFENFTCLNRYWDTGPGRADLAIDLFLGHAVIFCEHHWFLRSGIDSFNKTADTVRTIEPRIQWRSLGHIARHLYLKKLRDDGNYDVRAFCRCIELENTQKRDITYFVRKEEAFSPGIKEVTVDGNPYFSEKSGTDLGLTVTIPAGESRLINIEYENDVDLAAVETSRDDPYVDRLRMLCDFRDMTLSKNRCVLALISLYYGTGLYKIGLARKVITHTAPVIMRIMQGRYARKLRDVSLKRVRPTNNGQNNT